MEGGTSDVVEAYNRDTLGAAEPCVNDGAYGTDSCDIVKAEDGGEVRA
jgi:hypothetical protein